MPVGILRSLSALSLMLCIGLVPRTAPLADSSSPLLAAYYDRQMAIVDGTAYGWAGENPPKRIASDAEQVGVGRQFYYVLDGGGVLRRFGDAARPPKILRTGVASFAAGRSGVLAIGKDRALWWLRSNDDNARLIAKDIAAAAVGDSANYYVTRAGALFVKGLAHRGQYGDGKLTETDRFVSTASGVARVFAHTGHALVLMKNGDVLGTGGNIYGPVGRHGLGDKAVRWSRIVSGVSAVATGSSHSLAILPDGRLMAWGAGYGPDPVAVMEGVAAVAAGSSSTVVLKIDGSLWQWGRIGQNRRKLHLP
jgi:hypothetical protein